MVTAFLDLFADTANVPLGENSRMKSLYRFPVGVGQP